MVRLRTYRTFIFQNETRPSSINDSPRLLESLVDSNPFSSPCSLSRLYLGEVRFQFLGQDPDMGFS